MYVGKTIRQVRLMVKEKLEVAGNAPVSLSKDGGKTYGSVGENYRVGRGDLVEFSRATYTLCNITLCTGCGKEHCLEHGGCV